MILANAFCLFFFLGESLQATRAAGPLEPGVPRGAARTGACEQPGTWGWACGERGAGERAGPGAASRAGPCARLRTEGRSRGWLVTRGVWKET